MWDLYTEPKIQKNLLIFPVFGGTVVVDRKEDMDKIVLYKELIPSHFSQTMVT